MYKIIDDTESIALAHLTAFGFSEDQVKPLIVQAKKDMENELTKLQTLLDGKTVELEKINSVLHALKGLFFQVGNHEIAEQLNEIRSHIDSHDSLAEIKKALFY